MKNKTELRKEIRSSMAALPMEARASASRRLQERLRDELPGNLRRIGIFLPLPDEPDLRPVFSDWLKQGSELLLAVPDGQSWCWRELKALSPLQPAALGISIPPLRPGQPPAPELALVPGRAFTVSGERLGRGKGIYDRLLTQAETIPWGLCFSCQLREKLPQEAWDVRMARVLTESDPDVATRTP